MGDISLVVAVKIGDEDDGEAIIKVETKTLHNFPKCMEAAIEKFREIFYGYEIWDGAISYEGCTFEENHKRTKYIHIFRIKEG